MTDIFVIGAGGHGKVVVSTVLECGYSVKGIYDDETRKKGKVILDVPILGSVNELLSLDKPIACVMGVGDNEIRKSLSLRFEKKCVTWISLIHPKAYVHSSVRIGAGTVVFAGAVIQPDSLLGAHCIVNTGALIDHDCSLGDFCHVAHGCRIAGGVNAGQGAFLGAGTTVIPQKSIGAWAISGAGSTIIRDVPEGVTVIGTPAKILRR